MKKHFDGTREKHLQQRRKGGFTDGISAARKRKAFEKSAQNVPFFGTKKRAKRLNVSPYHKVYIGFQRFTHFGI